MKANCTAEVQILIDKYNLRDVMLSIVYIANLKRTNMYSWNTIHESLSYIVNLIGCELKEVS